MSEQIYKWIWANLTEVNVAPIQMAGAGDVAVRPMQADAAGVAATELNLSAPFKPLPKSLFDRAVDVRDLGKT